MLTATATTSEKKFQHFRLQATAPVMNLAVPAAHAPVVPQAPVQLVTIKECPGQFCCGRG